MKNFTNILIFILLCCTLPLGMAMEEIYGEYEEIDLTYERSDKKNLGNRQSDYLTFSLGKDLMPPFVALKSKEYLSQTGYFPEEIFEQIYNYSDIHTKLMIGSLSTKLYEKIHEQIILYICDIHITESFFNTLNTKTRYNFMMSDIEEYEIEIIKYSYNTFLICTKKIDTLSKKSINPIIREKAISNLVTYEPKAHEFLNKMERLTNNNDMFNRKLQEGIDFLYLNELYKRTEPRTCCDDCQDDCLSCYSDCTYSLRSCCFSCQKCCDNSNECCLSCCSACCFPCMMGALFCAYAIAFRGSRFL